MCPEIGTSHGRKRDVSYGNGVMNLGKSYLHIIQSMNPTKEMLSWTNCVQRSSYPTFYLSSFPQTLFESVRPSLSGKKLVGLKFCGIRYYLNNLISFDSNCWLRLLQYEFWIVTYLFLQRKGISYLTYNKDELIEI